MVRIIRHPENKTKQNRALTYLVSLWPEPLIRNKEGHFVSHTHLSRTKVPSIFNYIGALESWLAKSLTWFYYARPALYTILKRPCMFLWLLHLKLSNQSSGNMYHLNIVTPFSLWYIFFRNLSVRYFYLNTQFFCNNFKFSLIFFTKVQYHIR